MNEARLRELLREAPLPDTAEAEGRALRVARAAFAERVPTRRAALPRLALALTAATLLATLLLSPAGAAVRDWIDDVLGPGMRGAEPALTELPGGGRLLVGTPAGAWVVQPDGSRRLLGDHEDATWSPHGLFVAAVSGRSLSAIEPDGTARWSLSARAAVRDPRWSPSGVRIAYRAGGGLRVVAGDGTETALLDPRVAPVAPVWYPPGAHLLAYVDAAARLRIVDADSGERLGSAAVPAGTREIGWTRDGSLLLAVTPRGLVVRDATLGKVAGGLSLGPARVLPLPAGAVVEAAAFAPNGERIAALLRRHAGGRSPRTELALFDPRAGTRRAMFAAPGALSGLAWSPDSGRVLIGWPDADQWLFIPAGERGRVRAVAGISRAFAPGAAGPPTFPRVDGWCCSATTSTPAR